MITHCTISCADTREHRGTLAQPHVVFHTVFHFISFHFISFHFISFHFISFHFISFHFISFHFISFHFISFHFISIQFNSIQFNSIQFNTYWTEQWSALAAALSSRANLGCRPQASSFHPVEPRLMLQCSAYGVADVSASGEERVLFLGAQTPAHEGNYRKRYFSLKALCHVWQEILAWLIHGLRSGRLSHGWEQFVAGRNTIFAEMITDVRR